MSSSPIKTALLGNFFLFVSSSSRRVARRLKVDLHVNFTPVNETEAKYEVSQVNAKVERGSTFMFTHTLSYIASNVFTRLTNEIKAMYRRSSVHVKLNLAQPLRLCVAFQTLLLFYLRT